MLNTSTEQKIHESKYSTPETKSSLKLEKSPKFHKIFITETYQSMFAKFLKVFGEITIMQTLSSSIIYERHELHLENRRVSPSSQISFNQLLIQEITYSKGLRIINSLLSGFILFLSNSF